MSKIHTIVIVIAVFFMPGVSQEIADIDYADIQGNSYNLYTLLGQGKHVLAMSQFVG